MSDGVGQSIEEVRVVTFKNNVFHLSQQRTSRILPYIAKVEPMTGKAMFIDRMGLTEMTERSGRNQLIVEDDVQWSRRRLTNRPYKWNKYVDTFDKIQNIHDPEGEYSKAAEMAVGRQFDKILIAGALSNAYAGEEGSTVVPLPAAQKFSAATVKAATTLTSLNIDTLRRVRQHLWETEAVMDEGQVVPWITRAKDLMALLTATEVTSSDYNTVKALAHGEVDTYMGFKFIRTELIPAVTTAYTPAGGAAAAVGSRVNFCFVPDGICLGIGQNREATIDRIPERSNSILVQLNMAIGSTRVEDNKVIQVATLA